MMADFYQVILVVEDMAKMSRFYRDTLGLKVSYPADKADLDDEVWVAFDAGTATLALHGGGKAEGSGSAVLSLKVRDIQSTYRQLSEAGVDISEPRELGPGVVGAHARDPEGNRLSFDQVGAS